MLLAWLILTFGVALERVAIELESNLPAHGARVVPELASVLCVRLAPGLFDQLTASGPLLVEDVTVSGQATTAVANLAGRRSFRTPTARTSSS